MATELDQAYDHCQRIAKEHAKNFYYAFKTLPLDKRRAIYATYAFCRLCDDIADEEMPMEEKDRQFAATRRMLDDSMHGDNDGPVFTALEDAARAFDIPREYFEEIIEGVEMDLTKTRFANFQELREYCHKVASVVGLVCLEVFGYEDPKAKQHAIDLGLAMQITNILRDIKEDAEMGRVYLPLDEIERFGYSVEELMAGVVNEPFRCLMAHQAQRARAYFESGSRLLPLIDQESRVCPAVLHGVYSALLDRIEASGFEVFERRIRVSTPRKVMITARHWAGSMMPSLPVPLARR